MWSKQEKSILWVTSLNHFLVHAFEMGFPALIIPLSQYFNISLAAAIGISQGMYLMYGLGALPAGLISDKWNMRYMLAIGGLGAGIASILAAFSPTPLVLMIALTSVGIFNSIYHPTGISMLSHSVSQRGKALGLNGVFGNIGISSGPLMAGICNYLWGWRSVFILLGGIALLIGISALFVHAIPHKQDDPRDTSKGEEKQLGVYFLVVCLAIVFGGILYRAITVSLPPYMEQLGPSIAKGVTEGRQHPLQNLTANFFIFGIYVGGIVGQIIGGNLADRYDLRKLYFIFYCAVIPLVLLASRATGMGLVGVAFALVFFQLGLQPIENSLIARLTPVRWRSTAYGLKFVIALGVGSLAVTGVGHIQAGHGFPAVFQVGSVFGVLTAAIVGLLWYLSRRMSIRNEAKTS